MKIREAWKYELIRNHLEKRKLPFEFEYKIGKFIFDLKLSSAGVLVEFDGPYHKYQIGADGVKDSLAKKNGWSVIRVPVESNSKIPVEKIANVLKKLNI